MGPDSDSNTEATGKANNRYSLSTDQVSPTDCSVCKVTVENGICCDICGLWTHYKCAKLKSSGESQGVLNNGCIFFLCKKCSTGLTSIRPGLRGIMESGEADLKTTLLLACDALQRIAEGKKDEGPGDQSALIAGLLSEFEGVKKEVKEMRATLSTCAVSDAPPEAVRMDYKKALTDNLSSAVHEKVGAIVRDQVAPVAERVKEMSEAVLEEQEKAKRRANIIMHQLPEASEGVVPSTHDAEKVGSLLDELLGQGVAKPTTMYRLGAKRTDGRPRLLLVKLGDGAIRDKILSRAPNLKQTTEYARVYISKDRTPAEQKTVREEVLKRKERREQENKKKREEQNTNSVKPPTPPAAAPLSGPQGTPNSPEVESMPTNAPTEVPVPGEA